jgi:hypothetical protein
VKKHEKRRKKKSYLDIVASEAKRREKNKFIKHIN